MKKIVVCLIIFFVGLLSNKVTAQTFTQTFIDKCTGEVKIAKTTYINGNAIVSFYGEIRSFTPSEVQTGQLQIWLQTTYATYSSLPCQSAVVQQTIQTTVTQATAAAASAAATTAANAASS
ncbi:MAG: hypothetical protein RIQ70_458, partial [Bacteroidota bacterium]